MLRIKLFGLDIYGCQEALDRLDDFVDRELAPDETQKVQQHLRICHHCARKFRFHEDLVAGVRAKAQKIALPPNVDTFRSKLAELLEQEAANKSGQGPGQTH